MAYVTSVSGLGKFRLKPASEQKLVRKDVAEAFAEKMRGESAKAGKERSREQGDPSDDDDFWSDSMYEGDRPASSSSDDHTWLYILGGAAGVGLLLALTLAANRS